jgi:hypothetical protein
MGPLMARGAEPAGKGWRTGRPVIHADAEGLGQGDWASPSGVPTGALLDLEDDGQVNAGLFRQGVLAEAGRFAQLHTGGGS